MAQLQSAARLCGFTGAAQPRGVFAPRAFAGGFPGQKGCSDVAGRRPVSQWRRPSHGADRAVRPAKESARPPHQSEVHGGTAGPARTPDGRKTQVGVPWPTGVFPHVTWLDRIQSAGFYRGGNPHVKHHIANRAATALLCAATVIITGCGPDGTEAGAKSTAPATRTRHPFDAMTPEQIDNQARKAVKGTTSMRLTGKASSDGRQVEVDLAMDVHGSCNGTVGNVLNTMRIIKKGSLVYVKAEEDFWRTTFSRGMTPEQTEEMVALFTGRWIKPPRTLSQTLGRICDGLDALLEELSPVSGGNTTREADATVGGRPAAVLAERTTTETTTVYIAKDGKPYLLRATVAGGNEPVDLTFSDHNKPVDTALPPPDRILDPTTLR